VSDAPLIARLVPFERVASFAAQPASREYLLHLLAAARLAPSARNTQIWRFTVIEDRDTIGRAATFAARPELAGAAALIAARAKPALFKKLHPEQPFLMIDVPIAMAHISLAAGERGLAVEWVFARDEKGWIAQLGLDGDLRLAAVGFVGFPQEHARREPPPGRAVFRNDFTRD
jgi:hypothetical protein